MLVFVKAAWWDEFLVAWKVVTLDQGGAASKAFRLAAS